MTKSSPGASLLLDRCDALAAFSEEPGRITRTYLSAPMRDVHRVLGDWMHAAGMEVRGDAVGNIAGRLRGSNDDGRVVVLGSHLDTVPDAGRYDGILGVLAGLAVAEQFKPGALPFHLDVIGFSEEEGVRFRTPYIGSYAAAGLFDASLLALTDERGTTLAQAIEAWGGDLAAIPDAAYRADDVIAFLELHIEQGPVLEQARVPLGIVTSIIGQQRALVSFVGNASHAGTTPMGMRQDAGLAAARWIAAVADYSRDIDELRATVGRVTFLPGARNVVPGRAEASLDLRHAAGAVARAALAHLVDEARRIAAEQGCLVELSEHSAQSSVPMDVELVALLRDEARRAGHKTIDLPSGAGHDAGVMAQRFPSAMLFVPSPGGLSHNPVEAVREEDVARALEVLAGVVRRLAE